MKYWGDIQESVGIKAEDIDCCNLLNLTKNFNINKTSFVSDMYTHSEANFYTDGSKMSDCVGAGFILFKVNTKKTEGKFKLPKTCTVFQAEIKAILEAARHLNATDKYKYVKIFIDSQAAILALDNPKIMSTLVMKAINELNLSLIHI